MVAIEKIEKRLREALDGEVAFDTWSRGIYATDASSYQVMPLGIVFPKNDEDVLKAVQIAAEYDVSVVPRGGGTSLAGQAISRGLVIDFSRHMNAVLEINVEERWVRVQPGVVHAELNDLLKPHGLHFAPDPATSTRANIGGMIGNNSSGTKSILFGKTIDHVLETRVLLADGCALRFSEVTRDEVESKRNGLGREAHIYDHFASIIDKHREEIIARFPKVMRRVGGYNLDEFVHTDRWNLAKLFTGSEGSLGLLLEAKLNLEPLPKYKGLIVPHFKELLDAIRAAPLMVEFGPSAVELIDRPIIEGARGAIGFKDQAAFIEGNPDAILLVEFYGDTIQEIESKLVEVEEVLKGRSGAYAWPWFSDTVAMQHAWNVRANGLGLMFGGRSDKMPTAFIEDACVPLNVFPEYVEKVLAICEREGVGSCVYGHASVGVVHIRPRLDLRLKEDIDRYVRIARETFDLVVHYGGAWSGEHGDGLVRGSFIPEFFGPDIYEAFRTIKYLFDPQGRMNPGMIIDVPPMDENLRFGPDYRVNELETVYKYRADRDFAGAVHQCTGVGACRKTMGGTMCPSYRATRDENHSTRGRANAIRLAMSGQMGARGLADEGLHSILDLCLGCKGCKTECPSSVDLAKLKGEVQQKYYDVHGSKLRDRLVAGAPVNGKRFSGSCAPFINGLQKTAWFRASIEKMTGFDRRRALPSYAKQTFQSWFAKHPPLAAPRKVALFADTFTNYHEPDVGIAATRLLESCFYEVVLAPLGCCQRTRISQGFLRDALRDGHTLLRRMDALIQDGLQIVVIEPSCASALTDDLCDMVDDVELVERIQQNVMPIDAFILQEVMNGHITDSFVSNTENILLHGHCHQKALYGTGAMKDLLAMVDGLQIEEVDSGCCGMAGAFGYEKAHYELSNEIGELALFPAIRERTEDATVVACGFSCRHQIYEGTGVRAKHWCEVIKASR